MKPERSDRRIFLGMPGYAKQTGAAGEGFWCACKDDTHLTRDNSKNGSLLAANFNALWCEALNIVHAGGRIDYFAMLHNDIGPGKYWLDKLIDELESKQLDLLSVAVPIKDHRGLTSCAIDREGNPFRVASRLTMHDLFELPETFTSDDLGGRLLLVNTGCWVCKFDMAWAPKCHFEINDRISFEGTLNKYVAENESEDWFFSRRLHELGSDPSYGVRPLRVGATRKIQVAHRGDMDYLNDQPWGRNKVDVESNLVSPVPDAFPWDIHGWLRPAEGKVLTKLASGKRVLEIGTYCGLATVCLARSAESVVTVDYFDGRGTPDPRDTLPIFRAAIERHGVKDKVTWLYPDDELEGKFDLAFIDASHRYEDVKADIEKCRAVLVDGGVLAFHDYRDPAQPGVTRAVDELLGDGGELLEITNNLAVVKVAAAIPLEV